MRLVMTLLASSLLLTGCFGGGGEDTSGKVDLSTLRTKCSELSGFTGNAQYVEEVGLVFVWRADDAEVAECEWNDGNVNLVGILGNGHPGDGA